MFNSAFAGNVSITPERPVECSFTNHSSVNWVYGLKTIEDNNQIEISFKTKWGSCIDRKITYKNISNYASANFWQDNFTWPWSYMPQSRLFFLEADLAEITMTVNKNIIFSNKNVKRYKMVFTPNSKISFYWNILLEKKTQNKTKITLK